MLVLAAPSLSRFTREFQNLGLTRSFISILGMKTRHSHVLCFRCHVLLQSCPEWRIALSLIRATLLLLQVGAYNFHEFFCRFRLSRAVPAVGRQHVEPDMALDQFRHQAIQRSAAGRDELKYVRALALFVERTFDRFDLTAKTPHPGEKLLFFPCGMSH
jgi:hypothetical protein